MTTLDERIVVSSTATAALVAVLVVLWPGTPRGQSAFDPAIHTTPPDSCRSTACLRGLDAFHRGAYGEAARLLEDGIWSKRPRAMNMRTYTDMVLLAAVARERREDFARAAVHFDQLSKLVDSGTSYYAFRALRAVLKADAARPELLRQLERRGALSTPFRGVPRIRLAYRRTVDSGLPEPGLVRSALREGETDAVCRWISKALTATSGSDAEERRSRYAQLLYGFCLPPRGGEPYAGLPDSPTDPARIRRAERLYDRVEYEAALKELRAIDFDGLERSRWCRARFRLGRTHYRLDHHAKSSKIYRSVVDECDHPETTTPRIRSLYALGRRRYVLDDHEKSRSRFEAILEDYPDRSHADDALMYLGRIARENNDRERVKRLVERALEDYPEGDMIHEFVWEYLEPTFRSGEYGEFVDELDRLPLPEVDEHYYSQGRLAYFRARAEMQLGLGTAATKRLRSIWRRYPFSFYGYLARIRLRERDADPPSLDGASTRAVPPWMFDVDWSGIAVRHASRLGLAGMAAEMEAGRLRRLRGSDDASVTDADRWRLALLWYRAGDFVRCHNIPRRLVAGRPWVDPARGRRTRWRIAFPFAYRGVVDQAVAIEGRQRPKATVAPQLPLAIMREESGFDADIESWAGAVGLMQLMPSTARAHDDDLSVEANQETLRRPRVNIRIGVDHLHLLARYFDDHPVVMVAAYNAGMGAVRGWLPSSDGHSISTWVEDIPYRQTRNYAKRVMGSYAAYQWLAGRRRLDPAIGESPPVD